MKKSINEQESFCDRHCVMVFLGVLVVLVAFISWLLCKFYC